MTTQSALNAALVADTDHVACFARDGGERRWPELVAAAARVAARVADSGARRWALNLDDPFEFAAALLGCWAARKTPVLAPAAMLSSGATILCDAVLEREDGAARARERVVWEKLRDTGAQVREIAPAAQLMLYTSGSTGAPKEVVRQVHNVEAELDVLESLWGASVDGARFYSTVSHRHVYGMLFSVLWPLLNQRPFATFVLDYPEQLVDGNGAGHALVSSPALLKRVGHLAPACGWRAVFSSGGLLPADAAAAATRVLGACPIEVLGSTETSGVAWRSQSEASASSFTAMPRVETRAGDGDVLEVRSPFAGVPGWLTMGDRARFLGAGRFALLGRTDHLAKIEDKRVSLVEIEQCLLESVLVADAAAVALEHEGRQYVGAVVQLSVAGAAELARAGRQALNETLKAVLRPRIERIAVPRKFRYVAAIPVDTQGKRQRATLAELFVER